MFKIKLLYDGAIAPRKEKDLDAGWDLFNAGADYKLYPQDRYAFPLGFALELSARWMGMISEKSGMAIKQGIITIGNVIDAGYRGECHAILFNSSGNILNIKHGQKIAQLLVIYCDTGKEYELVTELSDSDRGIGGFGSTGL
jgi:dUTP pyrophosphatase